MTPEAAREFLKRHDVKYILAQFVDIHGVAKSKAVPVNHLDLLGSGAGFAGFAVWGLGMGPEGPDYLAVGSNDADAIIIAVGDIDIALVVYRDTDRASLFDICVRTELTA